MTASLLSIKDDFVIFENVRVRETNQQREMQVAKYEARGGAE